MAKRDLYGQFGGGQMYGQIGGRYDGQYGGPISGQFGRQVGGRYGGQYGGQIGQRAPLRGDLPLLRVIEGDHAELITTLRMIQEADVSEQRRVFPYVGACLLAHLEAKEEELHTLVEGVPRVREAYALAEEQEMQAERLVNRLFSLEYGTAAWNRNMDELVSIFQQNVRLEEEEIFPAIRAMYSVSQLQGAERRYITRKLRRVIGMIS